MPTPEQLWRVVYQKTRQGVPAPAREFLGLMGVVARWQKAGRDPEKAHKLLDTVCLTLGALRRSGLLATDDWPDEETDARSGTGDERWHLWRELRAQTESITAQAPWQPLTITRVIDSVAEPALHGMRVEVSFDSRLSQGTVVSYLRRLWPRLRAAHWVRRTRPLVSRSLGLIKHVCLETEPNTSWRAMLAQWNERHPGWTFRNVRAFQAAFQRAEEELTGAAFGLEWFYNSRSRPELWNRLTMGELLAMLRSETSAEDRRFALRQLYPFSWISEPLARTYAAVVLWAQELASKGATKEEIAAQLPDRWTGIDWTSEEKDVLEVVRELLHVDPKELPDPYLGGFRVEEGRRVSIQSGPPMKTKPPKMPPRPPGLQRASDTHDSRPR